MRSVGAGSLLERGEPTTSAFPRLHFPGFDLSEITAGFLQFISSSILLPSSAGKGVKNDRSRVAKKTLKQKDVCLPNVFFWYILRKVAWPRATWRCSWTSRGRSDALAVTPSVTETLSGFDRSSSFPSTECSVHSKCLIGTRPNFAPGLWPRTLCTTSQGPKDRRLLTRGHRANSNCWRYLSPCFWKP